MTTNIGYTTAGDYTSDSEAEMIRIEDAVVGNTCLRRDVAPPLGTLYVLVALPATVVGNWKPYSETIGGGGAASAKMRTVYFNGAGTFLLAMGPCVVQSVFLTVSAVGSVAIYDNTVAAAPAVLASTATVAASNVPIPVGAPPGYGAVNTAVFLEVVGASAGYVVIEEN